MNCISVSLHSLRRITCLSYEISCLRLFKTNPSDFLQLHILFFLSLIGHNVASCFILKPSLRYFRTFCSILDCLFFMFFSDCLWVLAFIPKGLFLKALLDAASSSPWMCVCMCVLAHEYNNTESWDALRRTNDVHGRNTEHELSSLSVLWVEYSTEYCM